MVMRYGRTEFATIDPGGRYLPGGDNSQKWTIPRASSPHLATENVLNQFEHPLGPVMEPDRRPAGWASASVSLAIHLVVLGVLIWLVRGGPSSIGGEQTRSVDLVLASTTADQKTEFLNELPVSDPLPQNTLADLLPAETPQTPTAAESSQSSPTNALNLVQDASGMTRMTPGTAPSTGQLSQADLDAIAEEQRRLAASMPKGEPATISVFGSGGMTGRKFVFLIDRSNSMGSAGLGVLDRAAGQLTAAIAQLEEVHQFQVVAYHHETVVIDQRALLEATAANKSKVSEFIHGLAAFGATEHENGLIAALAFRPDVVVLMSDGGLPEMTDYQMETVQRMCGKNTRLHCLQFGSGPLQQRNPFMRVLAEQNGGTYKYIDVNEWD